jgi:Tfp pilus assembly protein PilZ
MPDGSVTERRHERVPVRVNVRISTIDLEIDPTTGKAYFRSLEETCANVSRGGTFVPTRDPIEPGRRLLLELEIPDGPAIQTIGRVAWTRTVMEPTGDSTSSGFGIEFTGGTPEQLSQLEAFLAHKERRRRSIPVKGGWKTPTATGQGGA